MRAPAGGGGDALASAARLASHALHGRAPAPLADGSVGAPGSPLAARALRVYHSAAYRWPYAALVTGGLLLALAEAPSPLAARLTDAQRAGVRAADALVLAAVAGDLALQAAFQGARALVRRGWLLTKLLVLLALAANLAAHAASGGAVPYAARALRPLLLLERLRNVRKVFAGVVATAPRIVNVGVLLVLNLLLHSVLGFALFAGMDGVNCEPLRRAAQRDAPMCSTMLYPPQSCSSFFSSLGETAMHLFELMTAVNFPAVAIPVMRCRAWSPLFFLSFISTAVYLLFNLALAVAYNEFSVGMRGEVLTRFARVFIGLDGVFLRLAALAPAPAAAAAAPPPPPQGQQGQQLLQALQSSGGEGAEKGASAAPPAAVAGATLPAFASVSAWGARPAASTASRMAEALRADAEAASREQVRLGARLSSSAFCGFFAELRGDLPRSEAEALGALLFAAFARREASGDGRGGSDGGEPMLDMYAFRRLMVTSASLKAKRDALPSDIEDLIEAEEVDVLYVGPQPQVDVEAAPPPPPGFAPAAAQGAVVRNPLAALDMPPAPVLADSPSAPAALDPPASQSAAAAADVPASPSRPTPASLGNLMDARRQRVAQAAGGAGGASAPAPAPASAPDEPPPQPAAVSLAPSPAPGPALLRPRGNAWEEFAARRLVPLAAHPLVSVLFDATTTLAAFCVLTELTVDTDDAPAGTPGVVAALRSTQAFTLVYGVAFVCLRVAAWGPLRFWRRGALNRFDAIIVSALALGTALVASGALPASAALLVLFVRFLRLARVFRHVPGFSTTITALFSILPVLGQLALVLTAVLYAFAIVGEELFAGRLVRSNAAVAASSYGVYNYFAVINFDSLEGALWSLFYLLSVNDWVVLMEGCVAATSRWARAFFVVFWVVIVLFLLNVVIAFITVAFGAEKTRRDERERSSASRGSQQAAAKRIGGGRAGGQGARDDGSGGGGGDDDEDDDVAKAVAVAASALAGGAAEMLGLASGGARGGGGGPASAAAAAATAAAAAAAAPRAFVFGDWRATLVASGVDRRGWLLSRPRKLADVYDALYEEDLVATFQETLRV